MSVIGIGIDIVAVARLRSLMNRHGDRFLGRCFQAREQEQLRRRQGEAFACAVAGRWAAKEAFLKALGGSIGHIPYHDIAVVSTSAGAPLVELDGVAATVFAANGGQRVQVSISHEREFAVATVVIED